MEIVGGILIGLVLLTVLAAVGLTTVVAFGLMSLLGLLTEMSFKRLFFVSFATALLAPILLGGAAFAVIEDGSLERELAEQFGDSNSELAVSSGNLAEAIPKFQELRDDLREGRITPDEFEARLETLIEETGNAQIEVDGANVIEDGETIRIESN